MAELTMERSIQIGEGFKLLIEALNSFTEEELQELIHQANLKETMDPFIDPTRYRLEAESIHLSKKFLQALLDFKGEVKGIGNCK